MFPDGVFSTHPLALLQWSGLAVLTVALLILMRTRWGQAKPLSKCIGLSIFAHILLITYAYGTKLMLDAPSAVNEPFIRVSVVANDGAVNDAKEPADPWNRFTVGPFTAPAIRAPDRKLSERPPTRDNWSAPELPHPIEIQSKEVPAVEPDRDRPASAAAVAPLEPAAPAEAELDEVVAQQRDLDAPLAPKAEALPRRELVSPDESIPESSDEETAGEPLDGSDQLQRLAELVPRTAPGDVFVGDRDRPHASDNRVNSVDRMNAPGAVQPTSIGSSVASDTDRTQLEIREMSPQQPSRDARRAGDGARLPKLYSRRNPAARQPALRRYGGSSQTEDSVSAAIAWLAANQAADGHWDADQFGAGRETRVFGHDRRGAGTDADTGITGLALLTFLGASHHHLEGRYQVNVRKALEYLVQMQQQDGNLAGRATLFARMYCHGIASLALSEAYALTGDHRLESHVQRAIAYTRSAQHPVTGGWRYQPGDRGDMSQFGWQLMALKSAELAGIQIPAETRGGMLRFLGEVSSGPHGGLASYRRGERVSPVMTAEALACRYFLGQAHDERAVADATELLLSSLPGSGQANLYYWYYGTLSLFQAQGTAWDNWNRALKVELLSRQRTDGRSAGSWDPSTTWGGYGGRVYSTAMAALCLEIYYRYLPVYELELNRRSSLSRGRQPAD